MSNAKSMYAMSLDQVATAIKHGGHKRTILVEGHMGTGKSSLLKMLADEMPGHVACYFDCNTKCDAGDIGLPQFHLIEEQGCVTYVPNEELGFHLNKPIILMIDEFGKANKSVKNAMLRVKLERTYGNKPLHPKSVVFSTTNIGAEGVGDLLLPHEINRINVIRSRKPTNMEWIEWGLNNNIHHTLLGWCKDTPQLFHSFEDVKNPDDNPYIFHPQKQAGSFVTCRSLEGASDWMHVRDEGGIDDHSLTSLLIGGIGDRGAMDLMAFVNLSDQLPTLDSIQSDPMNAKIPTSASGVCMVVFRTLGAISKSWIDPWMDYLGRLDTEAQGMFVNGVRANKYQHRALVMSNKKFTQWAMNNGHLYSADKV